MVYRKRCVSENISPVSKSPHSKQESRNLEFAKRWTASKSRIFIIWISKSRRLHPISSSISTLKLWIWTSVHIYAKSVIAKIHTTFLIANLVQGFADNAAVCPSARYWYVSFVLNIARNLPLTSDSYTPFRSFLNNWRFLNCFVIVSIVTDNLVNWMSKLKFRITAKIDKLDAESCEYLSPNDFL